MPSLLLLNGSPRGKSANTAVLLGKLAEGYVAGGGARPEILHIARRGDAERALEVFDRADIVLFGMPLYTDAMPGRVKAFIESLGASGRSGRRAGRTRHAGRARRAGGPRLGFLIQSGFSEATHSRRLERYLEKLAGRLGCAHIGTVVKGGVEGVQAKPDSWNRKLFDAFHELGEGLARTGRLDPVLTRRLAGTERFSKPQALLYKVLLERTPLGAFYWDGMLKENEAYERRFARPYEPGSAHRAHAGCPADFARSAGPVRPARSASPGGPARVA